MDKLEKALAKARQQRSEAQQTAAPMIATPKEPSQPAATSFTVAGFRPLQEATLEANRIVAHRTRSAEADIFRLLRTQVLQVMNKHNYRTLAITSPNYGDGKTTIAINLALSIALDLKQTVLLADLDLRKPNVHSYLGIESQPGLTEHLKDGISLADCLQRLPFERLSILPAGKHVEHSSETLGSPQMAALAEEMRTRYADRFILYDMPPVLAQDDPLAFLPHADAVLLVVLDDATRTDEIKRCLDILAPANVIGTVLNAP